jgi:hypothetical protein
VGVARIGRRMSHDEQGIAEDRFESVSGRRSDATASRRGPAYGAGPVGARRPGDFRVPSGETQSHTGQFLHVPREFDKPVIGCARLR